MVLRVGDVFFGQCIDVELFHELVCLHGVWFFNCSVPECEQSDDTLGGDPVASPVGKPRVAVPFGESATVFAPNEWEVPPGGRSLAKSLVDGVLDDGGGKQVVASNDIGDALAGVVHDDGKLVGGRIATRPYDRVLLGG